MSFSLMSWVPQEINNNIILIDLSWNVIKSIETITKSAWFNYMIKRTTKKADTRFPYSIKFVFFGDASPCIYCTIYISVIYVSKDINPQ